MKPTCGCEQAFEKLRVSAVYSDGLGLAQLSKISELSTISRVSLWVLNVKTRGLGQESH